jgi:hypothetical protein
MWSGWTGVHLVFSEPLDSRMIRSSNSTGNPTSLRLGVNDTQKSWHFSVSDHMSSDIQIKLN